MHTQSVAKEIVLHKLDVDGDELRLGRDGDDDGLVVRPCRLPRSSWRDARFNGTAAGYLWERRMEK